MTDSSVQAATGQFIDNSQLVQTGGTTVQRQRTTNADPINVNNIQRTDSSGNSQVKEVVSITEVDASGTVGTTAATPLGAGIATQWVDLENTSFSNGNLLGFRFDGIAPTYSGGAFNAGTFILTPGGTKTWDKRIPLATLQVVGSAASTSYVIKYA